MAIGLKTSILGAKRTVKSVQKFEGQMATYLTTGRSTSPYFWSRKSDSPQHGCGRVLDRASVLEGGVGHVSPSGR